jgi:uncharacterized protein (DUF169 family)
MESAKRAKFIEIWNEYFPGAELPIAFWYADDAGDVPIAKPSGDWSCVICELAKVRSGGALAFDGDALGCGGSKRYFGFTQELREGFEYFLSCGIPGVMEGERYKKTPEMVLKLLEIQPYFEAPAKCIVFKRFDGLTNADEPHAFIFFAPPDVLSGLFTLSGYDEPSYEAAIAPFGAGCSSIVFWAMQELAKGTNRSILGMFDVSARPCVPENTLTFTVPAPRFARMIDNARESFLITESWEKVRKRIAMAGGK